VGGHPPTSPARASFTLMTECTPESSGCYSVYSVIHTCNHPKEPVQSQFLSMTFTVQKKCKICYVSLIIDFTCVTVFTFCFKNLNYKLHNFCLSGETRQQFITTGFWPRCAHPSFRTPVRRCAPPRISQFRFSSSSLR
jgi:hypothetical protein